MMKTRQIIGQIALTIISITYPLMWYFGRERGYFTALAALMCFLWLGRALMQKNTAQKIIALILAAFFALAVIFRQPESLYWYPVAINILMLALFGSSLFAKQTLIERLARLQQPDLPKSGVRYTRKVTQIWCIFFVFNGTITTILILIKQYHWWAIYTGIIAYILMGTLLAGEWLYRTFILKIK